MPDKKISQLALASGIDGDELIPVVQDGANVQADARQISQRKKHGFAGRTGSSLFWDPVSYEFALLCTDQDIWLNGQRYSIVSEGLTVPIGDPGPPAVAPAAGTWFITVQDDGTGSLQLVASQDVWSIDDLTYTQVATLYWNGSDFAIQEERHDAERNLALHEYLHKTVGARIQNDGSFAQTSPTTSVDGKIELVAGSLWDEDIENAITTAQGKLVRNWYETASGVWTWANGTDNSGNDRPYIWNSGTSRLQYPLTTNSYTLTDCADNRYIPVWVYASNDIDRPIYVVTPALATTYTTVAKARAALAPVLTFAPELKLLYRWIYRGDGEYQEAADYRTASSLPSGGVSSPVAASVQFTPAGNIAATNVQAMGEELDDEKYAKTGGTIAAATLTGSAETSAVEVTQEWNTTGNPTLIKANVTNTASGSTAKLLDLQVGGVSKVAVDLSGNMSRIGGISTGSNNVVNIYNGSTAFISTQNVSGGSTLCPYNFSTFALWPQGEYQLGLLGNQFGNSFFKGVWLDKKAFVSADAAGILAQRNSTNAQESRLYGSYTSDTNYHRLSQKSVRQAITAAAGATLVSTISIPKYSHLIGVTTRVTTALGTSNGTTGYTVGDGTDADLWGVAATATEGTTTDAANYTAADALGPDGSDRTITLTAVGGNFDGTGVIEVCAFYLRAEAD